MCNKELTSSAHSIVVATQRVTYPLVITGRLLYTSVTSMWIQCCSVWYYRAGSISSWEIYLVNFLQNRYYGIYPNRFWCLLLLDKCRYYERASRSRAENRRKWKLHRGASVQTHPPRGCHALFVSSVIDYFFYQLQVSCQWNAIMMAIEKIISSTRSRCIIHSRSTIFYWVKLVIYPTLMAADKIEIIPAGMIFLYVYDLYPMRPASTRHVAKASNRPTWLPGLPIRDAEY